MICQECGLDTRRGGRGGFQRRVLVSLLSHTYTTSLRSALTSASRGRPNTGFVERCRYVLQEEAAAAPAPGVQHKERAGGRTKTAELTNCSCLRVDLVLNKTTVEVRQNSKKNKHQAWVYVGGYIFDRSRLVVLEQGRVLQAEGGARLRREKGRLSELESPCLNTRASTSRFAARRNQGPICVGSFGRVGERAGL